MKEVIKEKVKPAFLRVIYSTIVVLISLSIAEFMFYINKERSIIDLMFSELWLTESLIILSFMWIMAFIVLSLDFSINLDKDDEKVNV